MGAETIRCEQHGEQAATFVCRHLLSGSGKGWITLESGDARPDAICEQCDTAWSAAGDEFANEMKGQIKVVCAGCYDLLRERHLTGNRGAAP